VIHPVLNKPLSSELRSDLGMIASATLGKLAAIVEAAERR